MTRAERKNNEAEWRNGLTKAKFPLQYHYDQHQKRQWSKPDPHWLWVLAKHLGAAILCGMVWGGAWYWVAWAIVALFWGGTMGTAVGCVLGFVTGAQAAFGYLGERFRNDDWWE